MRTRGCGKGGKSVRQASGGMGKRKNEQAPGGDAKHDAPRTKQSLWEGSEATAGDGLDATGLAQANDAEGKLKPAVGEAEDQVEMTHSGIGKSRPWSDGEAVAPEPSQEGKHVPQEGRDTGSGGGGEWPEAASLGAASHPESPQQANPALDEAEEDQPVATAEVHGSAGEDPAADTQTHRGTGNIGDRPEHDSAAAAQEEGAASGEIALPADAPGRSSSSGVPTEAPDPCREEGGNGGERRGDADQSQEPPCASVGNAAENEPGTVSEGAAVGERREGASGERPRAPGTTDAVKSAAESLREMPGEADVTNDDACGGDPPDLAAGAGEGEALGAEDATTDAPRTDVQPPARSGRLLCDGGVAGSALADPATPGPAPMGAAQLPAAGTRSAVGVDPWDEAPLPAELLGLLEGKPLVLPPQPPLPAADQRGSAEPGLKLPAAAGRSGAKEMGNGPEQPQPREDATNVICGLILELSNLNRLAMSAHRGLEALRRPKPRRSRWPGPGPVPLHAGRRWKET